MELCIMYGKSSGYVAKALYDYIHCPWLKPVAMDIIVYIGNNFFGRGINEVLFFLFLDQNVSLETYAVKALLNQCNPIPPQILGMIHFSFNLNLGISKTTERM